MPDLVQNALMGRVLAPLTRVNVRPAKTTVRALTQVVTRRQALATKTVQLLVRFSGDDAESAVRLEDA